MKRDVARIIDANFNRAREALRVMEDYVRFVLDDPAGCDALKRFRHDFTDSIRRLPARDLLAARDTPGDVGTEIRTEAESVRSDVRAVFVAAAKRLPEALRTIEEYGKIVDGEVARDIEALRYRSYDLEQRLTLRGDLSARFARVRLYVLMTASSCRNPWLATTEAAIRGGAGCIQLREKTLEDGDLVDRARRLAALCRERNVLFIVNDRPDVALLSGADGVHLGQTDMSTVDARRIVGPDRLIGVSTHDPDQLREAIASEPDYIAVGPMFDSPTKPQDHMPGPSLLAKAVSLTGIPIVPVGGISPKNMGELIRAGAHRFCVCSAVIGAEDVEQAARSFVPEL